MKKQNINQDNKNVQQLVVVLGMHRSGTSAIAKGLATLGVELGDRLMPPAAGNNDKGFFEDLEILALNEELLKVCGKSWCSVEPVQAIDVDLLCDRGYLLRGVELLRKKLATYHRFGFKDPRTSKLMPFWSRVFDKGGFDVRYVLALRNPISVAKSLAERDGFDAEHSYLLWIDYVLESLSYLKGRPAIAVDYDQLIHDPEREMIRMANWLRVDLDPKALTAYCADFLEEKLRHSEFLSDDVQLELAAHGLTKEIHAYLGKVLAGEAQIEDAKESGRTNDWEQELNRLRPLLQLADKLRGRIFSNTSQINNLHQAVAERDGEVSNLRQAVAEREGEIDRLHQAVAVRDGDFGNLHQVVAERDREIGNFLQAVAERDGEISNLRQTVTEREGEIGNLHQAAAERDDQIVNLRQLVGERDAKIAEIANQLNVEQAERERHHHAQIAAQNEAGLLGHELQIMRGSRSWRYTATPRRVGQKFRPWVRLYRRVTQAAFIHGGYIKLARKALGVAHREGWKGLYKRLAREATQLPVSTEAGHVVDRNDYQTWVRMYDTLDAQGIDRIREDIATYKRKPLISVVMPVYNAPLEFLKQAIESVQAQLYEQWELCIADDASTDKRIRPLLEAYAKKDPRIKVVFRPENGHISAASNSALKLAKGEFVALLDNDDLLPVNAIYEFAKLVINNPDANIIYSDEDKVDVVGRRSDPYFKPDYNHDLLLSHNLFTHLTAYRRSIVESIGGLRSDYDGAQDYDIALRAVDFVGGLGVYHISKVLYHWRVHPASTAGDSDAKPYAMIAGERALNDTIQRRGIRAQAKLVGHGYRVTYDLPEKRPLVSIIIPTYNGIEILKKCIGSIIDKTSYKEFEIILIDNNSDDPEVLSYMQSMAEADKIMVYRDENPFNYSALNNFGVSRANGDYVCLMNNDVEVIDGDWLREMLSIAIRPDVGAVGAKLLYPNNTLQHAGVVLGIGGWAGHSHKGFDSNTLGYVGRTSLISNFSAVTGACLLVGKEKFLEVGGLDEVNLKIACNDVDLCLKLISNGYRNVWTPYATLYHHESVSRGYEDNPEKVARFQGEVQCMKNRWGNMMRSDPAYNPNLTLDHEDFSLAWPPRVH